MAPTMQPIALDGQTLPESFIRSEADRPKVPYDSFSNEIPVISLANVDDEDDGGRRAEARRKIAEACEEWGVFQVVDHGVDQVLLDEVLRLSKEFFALPAEEKLKFDMTGGKRGGYLVSSHIQGMKTQDWREFLTYFTYPVETRDYTLWPEKPQGLTKAMEVYSQQLMGLAQKLLQLLSEAMGLAKDAIARACMALDQKVIANFYPKCPQPDLTFGLCRHTDPGTITILLQDQVGGLQVTRDGAKTWITVEPIHGAFVVNLGDHGHYLSNGRFKSADHRAVVNGNSSRFSVATFQYPLQESMLYPLAIRSGEKSIMEKPITFKEMYSRKMDEARAKNGR